MPVLLAPLLWIWGKYQKYIILLGAILGAILIVYGKGRKDQAALNARRQEEAVRNVQTKYNQIDNRTDTFTSTVNRLRDGSF